MKVAEYEHQFKVIDDAQKTFVVREFLTGPRKFDEIMDKFEFIINEMMADDGPVPTNLVNVGAHDARTIQA